jgi:hypothetical protein
MQPPSNPAPLPAVPRGTRGAVRLAAGRLLLDLEWLGDRWMHRVTIDDRIVAESIEGAADGRDPAWPASPAIVEVSRIDAAGRPAIVGVGLAGRSHFSLSVTPHRTLADTLLFEAACRIVEPATWLGSTYRVAAGQPTVPVAATAAAPPATVQWAYCIGPRGIDPGDHAG